MKCMLGNINLIYTPTLKHTAVVTFQHFCRSSFIKNSLSSPLLVWTVNMWYFGIVIHRRMHHICVSLHVYQVLCHVLPVSINTKIESCLLAYPRFFLLTPPSPFLWLWLVYIMHKWDSSLLTPTLGASSCRLAMSTSIGFSFFLLLLPRLLVLCMECFYLFSVVISVTCVSATLISHIRLHTVIHAVCVLW